MPTYQIEFWYSVTGTPNSFILLGSVTEDTNEDGSPARVPLSITLSPAIPRGRYWFRTRRVRYPDGGGLPDYSAFSAIREAVAPPIPGVKEIQMDPFLGNDTLTGLSLQPFAEAHGKPRKVSQILEVTQGRVRLERQVIASRALRKTTARRVKSDAGRTTFPFQFNVEFTPNTGAYLLAMAFGQPTTTRVGGFSVTLSSQGTAAATSLSVNALSDAVPSGTVLTFPIARSVQLNGAVAAGATSLTIDAAAAAVPSGTALYYNGYWIRVTANAAASATTLTVAAIPVALADNTVLTYTQYLTATTTSDAAVSATSIAVSAIAITIPNASVAYVGFKYQHEWINTKAYLPATIAQYLGDAVQISPGAVLNQFDFSTDTTQDTFVTPQISGNALNLLNKYTLAQSGLSTATTDALNGFNQTEALFFVNGTENDEARSVTFNLNRNSREKRVLRRKSGPSRNTPSTTDTNMTASLYFVDEATRRKYFGQSADPTDVYGVTCELVDISAELVFETCHDEGEQPYSLSFYYPKANLETSDEPVTGPDEIMQEVNIVPKYDGSLGSDLRIRLVNDLSLADIMIPIDPVASVPENFADDYVTA